MRYPKKYIDEYAERCDFDSEWYQFETTRRWHVTLTARFTYADGFRPRAFRLTRWEAVAYLNGFCDGRRGR